MLQSHVNLNKNRTRTWMRNILGHDTSENQKKS